MALTRIGVEESVAQWKAATASSANGTRAKTLASFGQKPERTRCSLRAMTIGSIILSLDKSAEDMGATRSSFKSRALTYQRPAYQIAPMMMIMAINCKMTRQRI